MKTDIHPAYYPNAKVKCACGTEYVVGATRPEIEVEICAACHPFFTGQEKILDIAGRIEKFKARVAKRETMAGTRGAKKQKRVKRQTQQAEKLKRRIARESK